MKTIRWLSLLWLVSGGAGASADAELVNRLSHHPSPYLALHGSDPVAWQEWSDSVLEEAKKHNRLIFISSGYFSCYWCHVMQRESFADPQIADKLNTLVVPVKIDRELYPALDAWLFSFTEQTMGYAGWPLNVFLTPQGHPLLGSSYQSKADFAKLLDKLKRRWSAEQVFLTDMAKQAFLAVDTTEREQYQPTPPPPDIDLVLIRRLQEQALDQADELSGGFGEPNKFPMAPQLISLLESLTVEKNPKLEQFLLFTLDQMAHLGLRDHLAGGFFRYTVDPVWDIPHFEKMLYDNALIAKVYLLAAAVFSRPDYETIAFETLDFVEQQMRHADGGYIASLSAIDDKGVEGGYYLWSEDELKALLSTDELNIIAVAWGVRGAPYLPDGHHIKQLQTVDELVNATDLSAKQIRRYLASAKQKLHKARLKRILPKDHKVLAAWNGLMLESLSLAAKKAPRYGERAKDLYRFLTTRMLDQGTLHRFVHQGQAAGQVSLEDYAYVVLGIVALAKFSQQDEVWAMAKTIALAGLSRFHNQQGWQLREKMRIPYQARELILPEGAMPSPSATLLRSLVDLTRQVDPSLFDRIRPLAASHHRSLQVAPFWYSSQIGFVTALLANMPNPSSP